jgi:hypothetical protein
MATEATKKTKHPKNTEFDELAFEAIDETLGTLGEQPKEAIYAYLKTKYHTDEKEIPQQIDNFSKALRDLFKTGATQLENACMKKLCFKVKNAYRWLICEGTAPQVTFREYLQFMKQQFKEAKEKDMGSIIQSSE